MEKRYQVFVSSTYADLKEERQHVIQAIMEMDCIPAGMELFPAADEEQWEFIKKVINDCDYYLLVIGGRYGSITREGISYTEMEFDYAVEKGLKVVALVHGEPENIPLGKSDSDPELREKLLQFRDKVKNGRLVRFWNNAQELPGLVALSLTKTIKMYPAVGWVRADQVSNEELLIEVNQLRKENKNLLEDAKESLASKSTVVIDVADLDSKFTIHGSSRVSRGRGMKPSNKNWVSEISWREIFALISPYLLEVQSDISVKSILSKSLAAREGVNGSFHTIDDQEFKTITIQLRAYGLVKTRYSKTTKGNMALFWHLTEMGDQLMVECRVIK